MAEHKQEEEFKVVDRRLFTAEGELRREAVEEERRDREAAAAKPNPAGAAASGTNASSSKAGSGSSAATQTAAGVKESVERPAPSRPFQMLVDFLTRNAAALLGGMADPSTGKAFVDLEGAHEVIDMLDVLREKTKGNLADEDEQLLLEVLGSLKLTYMEISKAAAQAMRDKAKAKP
ncbi:MAG: DUF1844 domain-containing protein [Candidatus Acidiferrales bacterium]